VATVTSLSTSSKPPLKQAALVAQVEEPLLAEEHLLAILQTLALELGQRLVLKVGLAWAIWTSFATTRNSSNYVRSYRRSRVCWSLFCSKLALETHS
jgi:hypothetical protein